MAEQLEFFEIPSPCRGICQSNEQGYCRGCYRTRDERFNWLKFSDTEKNEMYFVYVVNVI
nr:Predicted Fe-S protein [Providencia rettgeri]